MLSLVPLAESHVAALEPILEDPETVRFTRIPEPVSPGIARRLFERAEVGRADGSREAFAIVDDAGELLGLAAVPTINREELTAELGYLVAPAARGRGVASEGLRLLTEWAFGEGMLRLELLISVDNGPSKKVAERCGYTREGVLRSVYLKAGRRGDMEIWSRLVTD